LLKIYIFGPAITGIKRTCVQESLDIGVVHYVSNEIQAVNIYFLDSK